MESRQSLFWIRTLLLIGGLLCVGWAVVSIRALIDSATAEEPLSRIIGAVGPVGILLVVLGNALALKQRRES